MDYLFAPRSLKEGSDTLLAVFPGSDRFTCRTPHSPAARPLSFAVRPSAYPAQRRQARQCFPPRRDCAHFANGATTRETRWARSAWQGLKAQPRRSLAPLQVCRRRGLELGEKRAPGFIRVTSSASSPSSHPPRRQPYGLASHGRQNKARVAVNGWIWRWGSAPTLLTPKRAQYTTVGACLSSRSDHSVQIMGTL